MNEVRYLDGLAIIYFRENITMSSGGVEKLTRLIEEISGKGIDSLILNLENVGYIDSAGIGLLVKCLSDLKCIVLVKPTRMVQNILQYVKIYAWFKYFQGEVEAIDSFKRRV